jgi:integrase/recombinase XerC
MIPRRAASIGITDTRWQSHVSGDGRHGYRKNGGTLERTAQIAIHASTRTTQLYDRRVEEVTLDELKRVLI